jgi:hypothetical protein
MLLAVFTSAAAASNWTQFQGDVWNTGITDEAGPGTDLDEAHKLHLQPIDSRPLVIDDDPGYVYVEGMTKFYKIGPTTTIEWRGGHPIEVPIPFGEVWSRDIGDACFQNSCPVYNDDDNVFCVANAGFGNAQPTVTFVDKDNNIVNNVNQLAFAPAVEQCSCPIKYYNYSGLGLYFTGTANMSAEDEVNLTDDGTYYCLYADNGSEYWSRPTYTGKGFYWAGAAIIEGYNDTFVVYGDDAGNLTSAYINGTNCTGPVSITDEEIRSSICYNSNASVLYFTSKDGRIYRVGFNKATGEFGAATNYYIGYSVSTPAYLDDNQRVYVGGGSNLYCLDQDLTYNWHNTTNGSVKSSPVVSNSASLGNVTIYVTTNCENGTIYAIEDNGDSYGNVGLDLPSEPEFALQGPAVAGDSLYFGNDAGYLFKYN